MVSFYGTVVPGLKSSNLIWPAQHSQPFSFNKQVAIIATVSYYVQTQIVTTTIMEWSIGVPIAGQIRQTALDRLDYAY